MSAPIKQDAAFRWTDNGQDHLHYLGAKLRRPVANPWQNVHRTISADGTTLRVVALSDELWDLTAGIRFDGQPDSLGRFIAAGDRGAALEYFPSLSNPSESYPCVLLNADELETDRDLWWHPRYEGRLRLRRTDGGNWLGVTSGALFYWKAGNPLPGEVFTRSGGDAWYRDELGIYQEAADGIRRTGWIEGVGPSGLIELARTNALQQSAAPTTSPWSVSGAWTLADAVSVVAGATARKFTGDGVTASLNINQTLSTLGSASIVASVIVEQGDAALTTLGIRDSTAAGWVARADYTWATDSVVLGTSTEGSANGVRSRIISERGPNGGRVVLIECFGVPDNPSNTEVIFVYPNGTGTNSQMTIVHHAQRELGVFGSQPIVTAGATATRNVETLYGAFPYGPAKFEAAGGLNTYIKLRYRGTAEIANGGVFLIGGASPSSTPVLYIDGSSGVYRVFHSIGTAANAVGAGSTPSYDDLVELRVWLSADGTQLRIGQRLNGGSETTNVSNSASMSNALTAFADQRIYLGSRGSSDQGVDELLEVKIIPGPERTVDELAAA